MTVRKPLLFVLALALLCLSADAAFAQAAGPEPVDLRHQLVGPRSG